MKKIDQYKIEVALIEADEKSNLEALRFVSEINELEISNIYQNKVLNKEYIKIVLFNVERGSNLNEVEIYLKHHPKLKNADIIFFNELDYGMHRTGNINTAFELSKRLDMNYVYGAEFLELAGHKERISPRWNEEAFHGNAIFSPYEIHDSYLLRLPNVYDWYNDEQKRLGTRIAIFSKLVIGQKEIGLVCTHLENRTSGKGREIQMKAILDEVEVRFKNIPVIIAGDMNTNTYDGRDSSEASKAYEWFKTESDRIFFPEKYEPLIDLVSRNGFDYKNSNVEGKITRRKPVNNKDVLLMNLDWFFIRGLKPYNPEVVNTVFNSSELENNNNFIKSEGIEISDHNAVSLKCTL